MIGYHESKLNTRLVIFWSIKFLSSY